MKYILSCLCLVLGLYINTSAQKIDLSEGFNQLLIDAQMEFVYPLEAGYKDIPVYRNGFQRYDYAIRSRKEKLEIRYIIVPYEEHNPKTHFPQVGSMRMLTNLASNNQDLLVTGLDIEAEQLKEEFNADWGKVFFFQPKAGFSRKLHCKMLALHKEGKGTAYVFFLFDDPGRALDHRFLALRYSDDFPN